MAADNNSIFNQPLAMPMFGQSDANRIPADSDFWYLWAGQDQARAKYLKLKQMPTMITPEEYDKIVGPQQPVTTVEDQLNAIPQQRSSDETLGERFAGGVSGLVDAVMQSSAQSLYGRTGFESDEQARRRQAQAQSMAQMAQTPAAQRRNVPTWVQPIEDFTRGLGTSLPQTVASLGGAGLDLVTGNLGENQDYTIRANQAQQYYTPGGAAQTVGSLVPDIGAALLSFGGTTALSAAAAASKAPVIGTIGKLLVGTGEAVAPKILGKTLSFLPSATRAQRVGAAAGSLLVQNKYDLPELVSGRMNVGEYALRQAAGAAGGAYAAGSYQNNFLKNVFADAAVNAATGAVAEAAPLIPGGAEFDASQAWKSLVGQVVIGTGIGTYSAYADARQAAAARTAQADVAARQQTAIQEQAARAEGGSTANEPYTAATTYRQAEEILFGRTAIDRNDDVNTAYEKYASATDEVDVNRLQSIRRTPDGTVISINDAYTGNNTDMLPKGFGPAALAQAAETERTAYARALVAQFKGNEQELAQLLDLGPVDDVTQLENIIVNKWLVQAANGRGINGVEQKLAGAGLPSPLIATAGAEAPQTFMQGADFESGLRPEEAGDVEQPDLSSVIRGAERQFGYLGQPIRISEEGPVRVEGEDEGRPLTEKQTEREYGRYQRDKSREMQAAERKYGITPEEFSDPEVRKALVQIEEAEALANSLYGIENGLTVSSILPPNSIAARIYQSANPQARPESTPGQQAIPVAETPTVLEVPTAALEEGLTTTAGQPEVMRLEDLGVTPTEQAIAGETAPTVETPEAPKQVESLNEINQIRSDEQAQAEQQQAAIADRDIQSADEAEDRVLAALETRGINTDKVITVVPSEPVLGPILKIGSGVARSLDDMRSISEKAGAKVSTDNKVRQAKENVVRLANLLEGNIDRGVKGKGVLFNNPKAGGQRDFMVKFIADVEDASQYEILKRVEAGERSFGNGAIKLFGGESGDRIFTIRFDVSSDNMAHVRDIMNRVSPSAVEVKVKSDAAELMNNDRRADILDKAYADFEEAMAASSEAPRVYGGRLVYTSTQARMEGIPTEHPSEAYKADSATGQQAIDGFGVQDLVGRDEWGRYYPEKLNKAQDTIAKDLQNDLKNNLVSKNPQLLAQIRYQDIPWLLNKYYGPGYWKDFAANYVKNQGIAKEVDDAFLAHIHRKYGLGYAGEKFDFEGRKIAYNPVKDFADHNINVPDYVTDYGYKQYLPVFTETLDLAGLIARKSGIDAAQKITALAEWDATGYDKFDEKTGAVTKTSKDRRTELQEKWRRGDPTLAGITETDIEATRKQLQKALKKNAEVNAAYQKVQEWANKEQGAEAYRTLMQAAVMGTSKDVKFNLRDFPVTRVFGGIGSAILLDQGVERMEDDETYFGIPGSVVKEMFGGGKAIGYATLAGFHVSSKANTPAGTKAGFRSRSLDAIRRSKLGRVVSEKAGADFVDFSKLTPDQQLNQFESWLFDPARPFSTAERGSAVYEREKTAYYQFHKDASASGVKIANAFGIGKLVSGKGSQGVVTYTEAGINDTKLMSAKIPLVDDFIRKPDTEVQRATRERINEVQGPLDELWPKIRERYKKAEMYQFVNSAVELDRRMSDLNLVRSKKSEEVYLVEREQIIQSIKDEFFNPQSDKNLAGFGDEQWNDFLAFQRALDPIRGLHYESIVARSIGQEFWKMNEYYTDLLSTRDPILKGLGAAAAKMDDLDFQIKALDDAKNAGTDMPNYVDKRRSLTDSKAELQQFIDMQAKELEMLNNKIKVIEQLPENVERSRSSFYLFRHRDQNAPFVLRLQFDETTKLPAGTRMEYNTEADAREGMFKELRERIPEGAYARRQYLNDEIERLSTKEKLTQREAATLEKFEKEVEYIDGVQDLSNLSDAELMQFISNVKILKRPGDKRILRSNRLVATQATTRKVLEAALYGAHTIKANLASRANAEGAMTPRYIDGKGNATLQRDLSGNVVAYKDSDYFDIDQLVDSIDDMVDEPIDRTQLKDYVEKYLTFRDTEQVDGKTIKKIYVDMSGLKMLAEQYLMPTHPNLINRYNWDGYWDPQGKWTGDDAAKWMEDSINSMRRDIVSGTQLTVARKNVQRLRSEVNKYEVNNGLREYLDKLQEQFDPAFAQMAETMKIARAISRTYSIGTLLYSAPNWLMNRIYGAAMPGYHYWMNIITDYGVAKINDEGNYGPMQRMSSKAEAEAFVYEKQMAGEPGWRIRKDVRSRNFGPRAIGITLGAVMAPETTLRTLAKFDERYADALRIADELTLTQGSVMGSYALREGIKTGRLSETAVKWATAMGNHVEKVNNYSSILTSASSSFHRLGISRNDWSMMKRGDKTEAIKIAMIPHEQKIRAGYRAAFEMDTKIQSLKDQIEELEASNEPNANLKVQKLKRQIDSLAYRRQKVATPERALFDQLAEYMAYDRDLEQGSWDRVSKSVFERYIENNPAGIMGMTMMAPAVRSMNAHRVLFLEAAEMSRGATGKTSMRKLMQAYAPVIVGSAAITALAGMYAVPAFLGAVPVMDVVNALEFVYEAFMEEDEDKLTKMSQRQRWEELGGEIAVKNGYDRETGKEFVRTYITEGMIRTFRDINVSEGGSLASLIEGQGLSMLLKQSNRIIKGTVQVFSDMASGNISNVPYQLTELLPSGYRRISQASGQLMLGQKLDKDGNIIIDPNTGRAQSYSMTDAALQALTGKPWKETRSVITSIERGVPLYSEQDKQAWANTLVSLSNVKFGETIRSKKPGVREVVSSVAIAEAAPQLQYIIRQRYENLYKAAVESGKDRFNEEWSKNPTIQLSGGKTMTLQEIYATVAQDGGIKSQYELKGKGAESVKEMSMKLMDEWARTRTVAEAVTLYFGGEIPVQYTNEIFATTTSPEQYAAVKILQKFYGSYATGEAYRGYKQSR